MMLLNQILRKCTAGYKLTNIKQFAKNEKELETLIHVLRIYSQDIGMEFSIEKCAMLIMKSGNRHMTEGMELPNREKIRTLGEEETYKYLGILKANTIKKSGDEIKS